MGKIHFRSPVDTPSATLPDVTVWEDRTNPCVVIDDGPNDPLGQRITVEAYDLDDFIAELTAARDALAAAGVNVKWPRPDAG